MKKFILLIALSVLLYSAPGYAGEEEVVALTPEERVAAEAVREKEALKVALEKEAAREAAREVWPAAPGRAAPTAPAWRVWAQERQAAPAPAYNPQPLAGTEQPQLEVKQLQLVDKAKQAEQAMDSMRKQGGLVNVIRQQFIDLYSEGEKIGYDSMTQVESQPMTAKGEFRLRLQQAIYDLVPVEKGVPLAADATRDFPQMGFL